MNNVWHVVPVDDIVPHDEVTTYREGQLPVCLCICKSEHVEQENGAMIIIHNSFDGREGVEWAKEVLI